jgi:hypothetical protein
VAYGGTSYLLRPRPDGLGIQVRERPAEAGTLAARVARPGGAEVVELSARYVSEFGELLVVEGADKPVPAPAGRYRVESLKLKLADAEGKVWRYAFSSGDLPAFGVTVTKGQSAVHEPLAGVKVSVSVEGRKEAAAGQSVTLQPDVTAGPLYLTGCEVGDRQAEGGREVTADLRLLGPEGVADRVESGFA